MSQIERTLEEERRIIDVATPGPWIVDPDDPRYVMKPDESGSFDGTAIAELVEHEAGLFPAEHNGQFIAHARTALPLRNAQLRAVLEECKRLDEDYANHDHPAAWLIRRAIEEAGA